MFFVYFYFDKEVTVRKRKDEKIKKQKGKGMDETGKKKDGRYLRRFFLPQKSSRNKKENDKLYTEEWEDGKKNDVRL